jgi:Tfp pilus assembly protein PilV
VSQVANNTRPAASDEAGFSIVEAVVSALLVVVTSLAVYAGLDAA